MKSQKALPKTRNFRTDKNARGKIAKKKPTPLTERAHRALIKHGPSTSDAIAKICKVKSPAASKALAKLKLRGRADYKNKSGENFWRGFKRKRAA
jgi:predicted ArsR family transcriptional regulator